MPISSPLIRSISTTFFWFFVTLAFLRKRASSPFLIQFLLWGLSEVSALSDSPALLAGTLGEWGAALSGYHTGSTWVSAFYWWCWLLTKLCKCHRISALHSLSGIVFRLAVPKHSLGSLLMTIQLPHSSSKSPSSSAWIISWTVSSSPPHSPAGPWHSTVSNALSALLLIYCIYLLLN